MGLLSLNDLSFALEETSHLLPVTTLMNSKCSKSFSVTMSKKTKTVGLAVGFTGSGASASPLNSEGWTLWLPRSLESETPGSGPGHLSCEESRRWCWYLLTCVSYRSGFAKIHIKLIKIYLFFHFLRDTQIRQVDSMPHKVFYSGGHSWPSEMCFSGSDLSITNIWKLYFCISRLG